jgi:hypothetical protein
MTAAMLVLEPIFEADLPSELYSDRRARESCVAFAHHIELPGKRSFVNLSEFS